MNENCRQDNYADIKKKKNIKMTKHKINITLTKIKMKTINTKN